MGHQGKTLEGICEVCTQLGECADMLIFQVPGMVPHPEAEAERRLFIDRKSPIPFEVTAAQILQWSPDDAARQGPRDISIVPSSSEPQAPGPKKPSYFHKRAKELSRRGEMVKEAPSFRVPQKSFEALAALVGQPSRQSFRHLLKRGRSTRVEPCDLPYQQEVKDEQPQGEVEAPSLFQGQDFRGRTLIF